MDFKTIAWLLVITFIILMIATYLGKQKSDKIKNLEREYFLALRNKDSDLAKKIGTKYFSLKGYKAEAITTLLEKDLRHI